MYNKKAYKALADLSKAIYELLDAWENDEDFASVMDECNDTYPFYESLDEVYFQVENWTNTIRKRISVLESWEGIYDKLMDSADDNKTRMKILDMVKKQLEKDEKYPCIGADEE
jgi:hypothetical protein